MADNIVKIGNRPLARYRDQTLESRYELARRFVERFPIGEVIPTEVFDAWGIEIGFLKVVPLDAPLDSPEWRMNVDQRAKLKSEINLGGICDNFDDQDKFQVVIGEHAKSLKVMQFLAFIDEETESFATDLDKSVGNRVKKIEKLIATCNSETLNEQQRIKAITTLQSVKKYRRQHRYFMTEFLNEFAELQQLLEAPRQGVISKLIAPQETLSLAFEKPTSEEVPA
jgi:hypothetical protein